MLIKDYERSETMLEIYFRCKGNLSIFSKSGGKGSSEDHSDEKTDLRASPLKNNFNYQIYDDVPSHSPVQEAVSSDFYDNNYWNTKIFDLDFEVN
jgi:hypothetical protein